MHPILTGELLEPGEPRLGCLDPCLRILPLGAAVVLEAEHLDERRQRQHLNDEGSQDDDERDEEDELSLR